MVRILAIAALLFGIYLGGVHPTWPIVQCLAVVLCCAVTFAIPMAWPFLFPLLLVVGDAYPFTGQLVVQEYDSLLLGSFAGWAMRGGRKVAISEWRETSGDGGEGRLWWIWGPWILLGFSVVIAMANGLYRLPSAPWGDQLSVYFTGHNAFRIAKGYGWGILFAGCFLLLKSPEKQVRFSRRFVCGIQASIVYVGVFILLERWLFESLLDFRREFRAAGPFFTMHIGDQHVDAFIVLATPFAWAKSPSSSWSWRLVIGLVLSSLMLYAAFATMSRATIAAVSVEVLLLGLFMSVRPIASIWIYCNGRIARFGLAWVGIIGLAVAVVNGDAFRKRFDTIEVDWRNRIDHWQKTLKSNDRTWADQIIGSGMGTFPTMMATKMGRSIPPIGWRADHGGEIELVGGWPIYLEIFQWPLTLKIERLQFTAEPLSHLNSSDGALLFYRCFKSMFHSFEMTKTTVRLASIEDGILDIGLAPPRMSEVAPFQRFWRPESLGISFSGSERLIIRNLDGEKTPVESVGRRRRIASRGSAPWCFTCDDHLVWRAKNAFVHLYYEHGILGLLAAIAIVVRWMAPSVNLMDTWSRLDRRVAMVSLVGFSIVAFFGTLVDTPWIIALVLAVVVFAQSSDGTKIEVT